MSSGSLGILMSALQEMGALKSAILLGSLALAFAFEFVNGFHDTANAVATVIYTRSLRPLVAVIWSGIWNMIGIFLGGVGVAFAIVHLLPVDLLISINTDAGVAMVLAVLGSSLVWNFGTWYLGLPASSSHALIGSLLGVGMMNGLLNGAGPFAGVNFKSLNGVMLSLLISPLLGFALSAVLVQIIKRLKVFEKLNYAPGDGVRPPGWIRGLLIGTCTGVSFAHGSNDGQKGMGLVMLILIGLAPAHYALNLENNDQARAGLRAIHELEGMIVAQARREQRQSEMAFREGVLPVVYHEPEAVQRAAWVELDRLRHRLSGVQSLSDVPSQERWSMRVSILRLDSMLTKLEKTSFNSPSLLSQRFASERKALMSTIEYVPGWVVLAVALALGFGTMIGWQRIVVTVGEKIGKSHLTYGQGASAEAVAMSTIGFAAFTGLPVSTTHVLSSGIAGTMWANKSGVNSRTVRNIAIAWLLTLPVTMILSGGLMALIRWTLSVM